MDIAAQLDKMTAKVTNHHRVDTTTRMGWNDAIGAIYSECLNLPIRRNLHNYGI